MWFTSAALLLGVELVAAQTYQNHTSNGTLNAPGSRPYYPSPWSSGKGDWAEAYAKAQAFVGQMTLLEKVNLTTGTGWQSNRCDGPLGIRFADYNSAFPAGGTVAAAWDKDVWYQRGHDLGSEFRDKGIDVMLGPAVGPLGRIPTGGRIWEGFSPDPFLSGVAVAQTVKGIQDAGVVATTKHYILNEQEHFRQATEYPEDNIVDSLSSNIDDVSMHETYLWPFVDAVRAGTGSIMASYNQINNSYGSQSSYTLNHILKNELEFQGFVMSDWQGQQSGVDSILGGLDMAMPGDTRFNTADAFWGANLTIAVLNGTVPEWRVDDAATRIMAAYYYVGRDEPQNQIPVNFNSWTRDTFGDAQYFAKTGYGLTNEHRDVRAEHSRHIRDAAAKSTVLLKNKGGALPLTGSERFTGVFGFDATDSPLGPNGCSDRGCDNGTLAMGWGSGTTEFPYLVSPLEAIKQEILSKNDGVVQSVTDNYAYTQIQALARQATTSLVFVNSQSGEGYINFDGNRGDRNNLTVWVDGETLIKNVSALCNNTIVVIHAVGPVLVGDWYDHENITAILYAGLPGEQSGNAIADVLYGRANPSGKLPFTMGRSLADYGVDVLRVPNNGRLAPQDTFTEGNLIDYRHFDARNVTPVYEFGFGLSYTTFAYSNLQVAKAANAPAYQPNTGFTKPAPTLGRAEANATDYSAYVFPANFSRVPSFIYPYINSTDLAASSGDVFYGSSSHLAANATDGGAQPVHPAGGAVGGNPRLWDVLFTVTATVQNTGRVAGAEVAQVYVGLGGAGDPVRVLRGFEKVQLAPGASATVTVELTRRDLSNWDEAAQNWAVSAAPKRVFVGCSSRRLAMDAALEL